MQYASMCYVMKLTFNNICIVFNLECEWQSEHIKYLMLKKLFVSTFIIN